MLSDIRIHPIKCVVFIAFAFNTAYAIPPQVFPPKQLIRAGSTARLNCTAVHNEPVYWTFTPFGSFDTRDIYIGEIYLLDEFATSGRFSVDADATWKRYDLVIKEVTTSDGGLYTCIDERGIGLKAFAELIVWDDLKCNDDAAPDGYFMGENVFDLKQDTIVFNCSLNYVGTQRPQLQWFLNGSRLLLDSKQGSQTGTESSRVSLTANSSLNGARISCAAVLTDETPEQGYSRIDNIIWTSKTLHVTYAIANNNTLTECPRVERSLNCWPPCSYEMVKYKNGSHCHMTYYKGLDRQEFVYVVAANDETTANVGFIIGIAFSLILNFILGLVIIIMVFRTRKRLNTKHNCQLRSVKKQKLQKELPLKRKRHDSGFSDFIGKNCVPR